LAAVKHAAEERSALRIFRGLGIGRKQKAGLPRLRPTAGKQTPGSVLPGAACPESCA